MKLLNLCVLTFTVTALTTSILKAQIDFNDSNNDIFNADADNVTALMYYAYNGDVRGTKFLIERDIGKDYINAVDSHGQTAFMYAVASGIDFGSIARLLFDAGADIDARNNLGQTIDMVIASSSWFSNGSLFLLNNVNARDYLGRTLLMYVCLENGY